MAYTRCAKCRDHLFNRRDREEGICSSCRKKYNLVLPPGNKEDK